MMSQLICVRAVAERIEIALFSKGDLSGWQTKSFSGETRYSFQNIDGKKFLRADSQAGASGQYREIKIDLMRTPILNWTWRIGNILKGIDERTRAGDDFSARVYVVISGGLLFWKTRAINYVWSSHQPLNSYWYSAYTGNVRMIAVASGEDQLNQWVSVRRNVQADYKKLFGEDLSHVDAVAIMTDTDNSRQSATAWYGDIWFTNK